MLNTSQTTKTAFEQALLALAAYGDFNGISFGDTGGTSNAILNSLKSGQNSTWLSQAVADYIAANFGVVQFQGSSSTGYSGTLFRRRVVAQGDPTGGFAFAIRGTEPETRDLWVTDLLEVAPGGLAYSQTADMLRQWDGILAGAAGYAIDPSMLAVLQASKIDVTGHSLGGNLAVQFANSRASVLSAAFTFNGAGNAYVDRQRIPASRISNFIGSGYPDIVSRTGALYGTTDRIFSESGTEFGLVATGHSIANLVMGLGCEYLISLIDPTKSSLSARNLLEALITRSNPSTDSTYESFAAALRTIFEMGAIAGEEQGDATIFQLIKDFEHAPNSTSRAQGRLISFADYDSAAAIAQLAFDANTGAGNVGNAVRFSLVKGLTFAVSGSGTGVSASDSQLYDLSSQAFSSLYLNYRSAYMNILVSANEKEATYGLNGVYQVGPSDSIYIDRETNKS